MKFAKLLVIAAAAIVGFVGCGKEIDHTNDIVGTWIYCQDGQFEALTINADGSLLSSGMEDGEYWKDIEGQWTLKEHKFVMAFEDEDDFEGTVEVVAGHSLSITPSSENQHYVYDYAEKTLPSKFVGTWSADEDSWVETLVIKADGSVTSSGNDDSGESWTNVKGNILIACDSIYISFEDDDDFAGKYEIVSGETLVLINIVSGERTTYRYSK